MAFTRPTTTILDTNMVKPRAKKIVNLSAPLGIKSDSAAVAHSCTSFVKMVSAEQIQVVAKFLPIFENIDPDDFAHMIPPPMIREDVLVLGHIEYHGAVHEFMTACYENGFVQSSFDWVTWSKEGRRYMMDPTLVGSARLATCIKLITAHLRAERFCDGHLDDVLRSGHIIALLRRLQQFAR